MCKVDSASVLRCGEKVYLAICFFIVLSFAKGKLINIIQTQENTRMIKLITAASMLVATSIVSVGAAIASPPHTTVSGQPAAWRFGESQTIQTKPTVQPTTGTQDSKPQAAADKGEVKSIDVQPPAASVSRSNSCTGDAASATPPVVNNPHHLRNVVWRNARMACTQ